MKKVLIISAHADDESFGMGGTLSRMANSKNYEIHWLILSKIWYPKWSKKDISMREKAINLIASNLNIKNVTNWDYKDNCLDSINKNELQEKMIELLDEIKPENVFTPSIWDFNFEHKLSFEIIEMATKAFYSPYIKKIIAYEIPSSTDHSLNPYSQFHANYFINITGFFQRKIELINCYPSELHEHPHPRSVDYIESLAKIRGGQCGYHYAEAFHLLKAIK